MYTTNSNPKYKTYQRDDPEFHFSPDNIMLVPRAGLEIDINCPREYKMIMIECINNGWLKPIAYQPELKQFLEN